MSSLWVRYHRWRYDRYMQRERSRLTALAASPSWTCGRCGCTQPGEGRSIAMYWEGSNDSDAWPRASFVAMSCWECGAPITKTVRDGGGGAR